MKHCADTREITGGHYHYAYSVHKALPHRTQVLYLAFGPRNESVRRATRIAKNLKVKQRTGPVGKMLSIGLGGLRLAAELFAFRPDHILMVPNHGLLPCYLYSRFMNADFALSIHSDLSVGNWVKRGIERLIIQMANTVICHGPYLAQQVRAIRGEQTPGLFEYNASARDLARSSGQRLPKGFYARMSGLSLVTCIGRLEEEKGIFDLYEAFKHACAEKGLPLGLCYAGDGSDDTVLKRQIEQDGLTERVFVLGRIPRQAVAELLRASWVVVTPTRTRCAEGRCMTGMEALALGVPLIAPGYGAFEYLVRPGVNGLFYTPDSRADLARQLDRITSPELREKLAAGALAFKDRSSALTYGEAVKAMLETRRKGSRG